MAFDCIGVFDSGVGGLTVLRQLQKDCPNCKFIYLADYAHYPYGTKSSSQLLSYANKAIKFLQKQGAQAVVLACNTISCLRDNLQTQTSLPLYDVITPTAQLAVNTTKNKQVILLATSFTVKSEVYQRTLDAYGINTIGLACDKFVQLAEQSMQNTPICQKYVTQKLKALQNCNADTVILGCTHFPLLSNCISRALPDKKIVQCSCNVALKANANGCVCYYTTGNEQTAKIVSDGTKAPFYPIRL